MPRYALFGLPLDFLRFLGFLEKATNTAGDGILTDRRIGKTPQFFKARLTMVETELTCCPELGRNIVAQNLERLSYLLGGFLRRFGAATHIRIIKVRQTIRLATWLAISAFPCPLPGGAGSTEKNQQPFDGVRVTQRDAL